jgi:hypothetical protein
VPLEVTPDELVAPEAPDVRGCAICTPGWSCARCCKSLDSPVRRRRRRRLRIVAVAGSTPAAAWASGSGAGKSAAN